MGGSLVESSPSLSFRSSLWDSRSQSDTKMSPWIRLPVIARIPSVCHRLLAGGRLFHIFTPLAIGFLHVGSESLDLVIDPAIRCFDSSLDFHLLDHRLPSASCRWPQHLAIRRDDSTLAFHFFPEYVCIAFSLAATGPSSRKIFLAVSLRK